MSICIRPVEQTDRDEWLRLWLGYQAFYRVELPAAATDALWLRLHDHGEPISAALAVVDARPVGLVQHVRHRSTWTPGDYCYLQDLFVDPEARGKGLGRKLIEHVFAVAAAAGCSRVHWLTHETNADAMLLYGRIAERSGFVQYRKVFSRSDDLAASDPSI